MIMRCKLLRLIIVCALLIQCVVYIINAQEVFYSSKVEEQFKKALEIYSYQNYDSAAVLFDKIIRENPKNHRVTALYLMSAKAHYFIKHFRQSIQLLKDLIDLYPHSLYISDTYFTLAANYIQLRRYEDAAFALVKSRQTSNNEILSALADSVLEQLTAEKLKINELELLLQDVTHNDVVALLKLRLAEQYYKNGDVMKSQRLINDIFALPKKTKYHITAQLLLEAIEKRGVVKIGTVLPLMSKSERQSLRESATEFLEGIQYAIEEYNKNSIVKVSLEVRDSERDPTVAARSVSDLTTDEAVSVIIGPLSSNEVLACAGIANERGTPLITPTATANGIANIGSFIFQANPDFEVRGRVAAQYSFYQLNARRFGILAPSDVVGKQVVDAFIDEIKKLGGEIVAQQWYLPHSQDVRNEIAAMRQTAMAGQETTYIDFSMKLRKSDIEKIIQQRVPQKLLDSLLERQLSTPVELLFGPRGKIIADSLNLPTRVSSAKYDSLQYPVTSIDVLFIPLTSSSEIPVISSQVKYYNFQAQIIGTGDWYDLEELDQNRQYTDGVIFFVDSYVDVNDTKYQEFQLQYQQAMKGKLPTTNSLITYDVTKLVLQKISEGSSRRSDLAFVLAQSHYTGWRSDIIFHKKRVNTSMNVLQYKGRTLHYLGKYNITE